MIDSTTILEAKNYVINFVITYSMNYKTFHFKTLTEYSLQYHTNQVQTKSKQQLQYNYDLGAGQRQN